MRLSRLQKFIILRCLENKSGAERKMEFYNYYSVKAGGKKRINAQVSLQNSIENLVAKNLLVAFGHKTAKKWSFNKVKLTASGKKIARSIIAQKQGKLPIR